MPVSPTVVKKERSASYNRGRWTGTQKLLVYYASALAVADVADAIDTGFYTNFGGDAGTTEAELYPFMRFVSADYFLDENGADRVWHVTLNFESNAENNALATVDTLTETETGFTALEIDTHAQEILIYRSDASLPATAALVNDPDDNNIGGKPVDSAGYPMSKLIPVTTLSCRFVKSGRPNYDTIHANMGKRNDAAYTFGTGGNTFTVSDGSAVFMGAHATRIGPNQYDVSYQFIVDFRTKHLRQIAYKNADLSPKLKTKNGGAVSITNPWVASDVYWRQPIPQTCDFTTLGLVFT